MLITRPLPAAAQTAELVATRGWLPLIAPMLSIEPLRVRLPAPRSLQSVLITSANALDALSAPWHRRRLLAVGAATARRARELGFEDVLSADGDALALARLAIERLSPADGPLLLATARGQGEMLVELLRARGFGVLHRAVYTTRPVSALPEAVLQALARQEVAAVLFYSAETARAFDRAVCGDLRVALSSTFAVSISAATDAALGALPFRDRLVAIRPDQQALLDELPLPNP